MENFKITKVNISNSGGITENAMEEVFLSATTLVVSAITVTDTINNSNSGVSTFVSFSATNLSGGTIYSGNTNLQNTFNSLNSQIGTKINSSGGTFTGQVTTPSFSSTTVSGGTIYSGGTNLYSIFQPVGGGTQTGVAPGSNITTGGTFGAPVISLVASPSVNNLISSGSSQLGVTTATSISGGTVSGGTLYSGSTNLYSIFQQIGTGSGAQTGVAAGSNITTGGTFSAPVISLVASPSVNNLTASGSSQLAATTVTSISGGTVSGGTIYSGGTNLYSVFQPIGGLSTNANGTNTYTGGTFFNQTINVSALTINTLVASGSSQLAATTATSISGGTVSGGTLYSGSTNLYSVFQPIGGLSTNANGTNTYTGGTFFNQTINVSALTINTLVASGSSQLGVTTATSISGGTVSGGTLYSGSTNLYSIFQTIGGASGAQTGVAAGSNITTGGTFSAPVISLVASPSVNNLTASGSSQLGVTTATSISGGTVSGGTLYSGSTNLYSIFQTVGGSGSTITGVINLDNGLGFYKQTTGTTLLFRSISAGTNVYFTTGDTITVNSSARTDMQSVEQSLSSTTSSTSFVDVPGFSATTHNLGEVGTYEIEFDCFTSVNTQNASIFYQIVVNGVAEPDSIRRVNQYNSNSAALAYMSVATSTIKASVASGTVIKVQWRVSSGTATIYSGALRILGVPNTNII
jgi:hypothetical protein